ncbi:hypothetical protein ERJ75_001622900 [Trypanosoma vivax]|uniref:Uncharacterized protein n=1 Tax=Trypanosoma vivax (strain Y486) TaxID=1055687 RepID=G0TT87_TRYVY|nr:hypothetical protein TRVL_03230 [Trypanosoma vivax]KAH8605503.1 hypothetical protein ERJ75_001622900 [Trypanosoma vivax]CCC47168.1 hypothetical protein TVY486_0303440 [Trypanosoma vivax Y486]
MEVDRAQTSHRCSPVKAGSSKSGDRYGLPKHGDVRGSNKQEGTGTECDESTAQEGIWGSSPHFGVPKSALVLLRWKLGLPISTKPSPPKSVKKTPPSLVQMSHVDKVNILFHLTGRTSPCSIGLPGASDFPLVRSDQSTGRPWQYAGAVRSILKRAKSRSRTVREAAPNSGTRHVHFGDQTGAKSRDELIGCSTLPIASANNMTKKAADRSGIRHCGRLKANTKTFPGGLRAASHTQQQQNRPHSANGILSPPHDSSTQNAMPSCGIHNFLSLPATRPATSRPFLRTA